MAKRGTKGILALSRRPGQGIFIGRGIRITIVEFQPNDNSVKLAIEAPANVAVSRDDFSLDFHMRQQVAREGGES